MKQGRYFRKSRFDIYREAAFFLEEIAVKPENQVISGLKGEEGSWIFVRIRTFKKWN
jgi:hypothetical protein